MQNEFMKRTFFRAIETTKDLRKANYIVCGDYLSGENNHDYIEDAMRIYELKMSECFRILAFVEGKTKQI